VPERVVLQLAAFAGEGPAESFVDEIKVIRYEGLAVCPAVEATSLAVDGPVAAAHMHSPAALYLLDETSRALAVVEATAGARFGGATAVSYAPSNGVYSAETIGGQPALAVGAPPLASGGPGSASSAGASVASSIALDPSRGYIELPAFSRFDPLSGFSIDLFLQVSELPTGGAATILSDRAGGTGANDFGLMLQLMTNGSLCVRRQSADGVAVLVTSRPVLPKVVLHVAVVYRARDGLTYIVIDGEEDVECFRSGTAGPGLNIGTPLALSRPLRIGFDGFSVSTSGTHGGGGSMPLGSLA